MHETQSMLLRGCDVINASQFIFLRVTRAFIEDDDAVAHRKLVAVQLSAHNLV